MNRTLFAEFSASFYEKTISVFIKFRMARINKISKLFQPVLRLAVFIQPVKFYCYLGLILIFLTFPRIWF
ncbi:MAG: hypothetical protein DRI57_31200 [Deltaproteobacteria bacterium]|nr:MAG: hypothetical protein DRI57_31200 [Deltaproteobacteria bacterium]